MISITDSLANLGYKCFVRESKDKKKNPSWFMRMIGVLNPEVTTEIQKYYDTFRVPIQRCNNSRQSLAAVNKLIPIIRNELKPSDTVLKALNWALWEIVDNAGIHGYGLAPSDLKVSHEYSNPVYFCAYKFEEMYIDISIIDRGQGILKSFLSSGIEKYKNINNEKALQLAITLDESSRPDSMGFGLFGCSELVRASGGKLVIISHDRRLTVTKEATSVDPAFDFDGTMVIMQIPHNAVIDLANIFGKNSMILNEDIDDLIGEF